MEKEIIIDGKNIFYRVFGKGDPVMLVHGFGETGQVWNEQIQAFGKEKNSSTGSLTDKFKFIIPDLPGSGRSELINDMSMEGMAEVLKQLFDNESIDLSGSSQNPPSIGRQRLADGAAKLKN